MKIIGMDGSNYIAIVPHSEIEKCMGKYGYMGGVRVELKTLKSGDVVDIGAGYNYLQDMKAVCREMTDASKAFGKAQETMIKFADMVLDRPEQAQGEPK